MLLLEYLICRIEDKTHIAYIIHLSLARVVTLFMYFVIGWAILCVNIIAWHKDNFPALILVLSLDTIDHHNIPERVLIYAEH